MLKLTGIAALGLSALAGCSYEDHDHYGRRYDHKALYCDDVGVAGYHDHYDRHPHYRRGYDRDYRRHDGYHRDYHHYDGGHGGRHH